VLRKDETAASQTYKYAKVTKVHTSADGKVRAVVIEYKLPGESVFRTTTRPIHKLVLVVPVEEQALARDRAGEEGVESEQAAPLVEEAPELAHMEKVGAAEATPPTKHPRPAQQKGAESAGEEGGSLRPRLAPFRAGKGQQGLPSSSKK
jgi:uncharacterized membrane protein